MDRENNHTASKNGKKKIYQAKILLLTFKTV